MLFANDDTHENMLKSFRVMVPKFTYKLESPGEHQKLLGFNVWGGAWALEFVKLPQ